MARNESDKVTRVFVSGAERDLADDKIDIEGHLDFDAIMGYCEYMHKHRFLEDGRVRPPDNWKLGIPIDQYVKSLSRHYMDVVLWHQHKKNREPILDALYGVMFNTIGMIREIKKDGK